MSLLVLLATTSACAPADLNQPRVPGSVQSSSAPDLASETTAPPPPPASTPDPTPSPTTPPSTVETPPDVPETSAPGTSDTAVDDLPIEDPTALVPGSNHNVAAAAYAHPAAEVHEWMAGQTLAQGKIVFLTFDDGPNDSVTPQVLDILAGAGVPATFFIQGSAIAHAPAVLRRTIVEGHAVALHSWSHDYKKMYPGRSADATRVGWEFDTTLAGVRDVLGPEFNTGAWRYPGGHMSWTNMSAADAVLAERGATWLDWNAMFGDAEPKKRRPTTVEAMVAMATVPIAKERQVVVLLAHDAPTKQLTADSLPGVIAAYQAAGYEFGVIA